MNHRVSHRRVRRSAVTLLCALSALQLVACMNDKDPGGPVVVPPGGVVVLNGYGQPGVTIVGDTGSATSRIDFTDAFDGATIDVAFDTAVAASSKANGDQLFVAALAAGTLKRIQLPAGSNPAAARLAHIGGTTTIAVALRDSSAIAAVTNPSETSPTIVLRHGAGECPTDVAIVGGAIWSVDAHSLCRTTYAVQGPVRLIRAPATAPTDTITLGSQVTGSGASAIVRGNITYVAAIGQANFATMPATSLAPASIARVDMSTRATVVRQLPGGTFGAVMHVGTDGDVYVVAYENLSTFVPRVYRFTPDALAAAGPFVTGQTYLDLKRGDGSAPQCAAATATTTQILCADVGAGGASTLRAFNRTTGVEERAVAAGVGAVDLELRR